MSIGKTRGRPKKLLEEEKEKYVVGRVPTDYETVIVNNESEEDEVYTVQSALAKIMNDLEELKKLLD